MIEWGSQSALKGLKDEFGPIPEARQSFKKLSFLEDKDESI